MEQRSVIITAVILALGLAGALWYSMTGTIEAPVVAVSPTPTAIIEPAAETPAPEAASVESPTATNEEIAGTADGLPVSPSAPSGTPENVAAALLSTALVGAYTLRRAVRTARA